MMDDGWKWGVEQKRTENNDIQHKDNQPKDTTAGAEFPRILLCDAEGWVGGGGKGGRPERGLQEEGDEGVEHVGGGRFLLSLV